MKTEEKMKGRDEAKRRRAAAKDQRGRKNIDAMHAAADRELSDGAKYGRSPWGPFYHYMAMELAPHATKKQMTTAIEKALRFTEAQEAGIRQATPPARP